MAAAVPVLGAIGAFETKAMDVATIKYSSYCLGFIDVNELPFTAGSTFAFLLSNIYQEMATTPMHDHQIREPAAGVAAGGLGPTTWPLAAAMPAEVVQQRDAAGVLADVPDPAVGADYPALPAALHASNLTDECRDVLNRHYASDLMTNLAAGILGCHQIKPLEAKSFDTIKAFSGIKFDSVITLRVLNTFRGRVTGLAELAQFAGVMNSNPFFRFHTKRTSSAGVIARAVNAINTLTGAVHLTAVTAAEAVIAGGAAGPRDTVAYYRALDALSHRAGVEAAVRENHCAVAMAVNEEMKMGIDNWYAGKRAKAAMNPALYRTLRENIGRLVAAQVAPVGLPALTAAVHAVM